MRSAASGILVNRVLRRTIPCAKAASKRLPAIRSTGAIPSSTTRPSLDAGAGAHLRHLPRLPALREPVQRVSDAVRPGRRRARPVKIDGVAKADFGKVVDQCYLCDICYMTKCSVRSAASLERGLSAPDAARQGDASSGRARRTFATGMLTGTDRAGQARDDSGGRADGEQGERDAAIRRAAMEKLHRRAPPSARLPPVRDEARSPQLARPRRSVAGEGRASARRARWRSSRTCYVNYNEPGIGLDLLAMLDAQRDSRTCWSSKEACCGMPEARAGRSRIGRETRRTRTCRGWPRLRARATRS